MSDLISEQSYAAWAPDESPWSAWTKPVLFASLGSTVLPAGAAASPATIDLSSIPGPRDMTAVVVDLPGVASVDWGLALAERGFRPVPLYNTCHGPSAAIDVLPIAAALRSAAEALPRYRLRSDAPPVFLLDAERMKSPAPQPGRFDNRWLVFPQDFPSAAFLRSRGIGRVVVVQDGERPRDDLAHVLLRWQLGGIELSIVSPKAGDRPRPLIVHKPSLFRRAWYRVLASMGLRRSNVGGFGALVPIATATG